MWITLWEYFYSHFCKSSTVLRVPLLSNLMTIGWSWPGKRPLHRRLPDGIFLKLNKLGQLVIVDAARLYDEQPTVFLKGMSRQKFRSLTVMTMKELSY